MNFHDFDFDYTEGSRRRQGPPTLSTTEPPETASRDTLRLDHEHRNRLGTSSANQSVSPQPTTLFRAPSPPSPPSLSDSSGEIYGPDRFSGPPFGGALPAAFAAPTPPVYHSGGVGAVRFDEAQLAMFAAQMPAHMGCIKDELALAAGKVTPGVDDTPYIQYAIDALTRDRDEPAPVHFPSGTTEDFSVDYPQPRLMSDSEAGLPELTPPEPAYVEDRLPPPEIDNRASTESSSHETIVHHEDLDQQENPVSSLHDFFAARNAPERGEQQHNQYEHEQQRQRQRPKSVPVGKVHPPLNYKPPTLRPFSFIILITLCLLMVAGLIVSAVYSNDQGGLTPYPGTIYSGQYFVFRILPQMLAALILMYAQAVVVASQRVLPFAAMADEEPRTRYLALFRKLYPRTFLLPQFTGPWQFQLYSVATWLANFTIPLQSTIFTCTVQRGRWTWSTVQGPVWTLVAIYIALIISAAILMVFWFKKWTGLLWDVRSIGHLVPLLNQSNTTNSYESVDVIQRGSLFQAQLRDRHMDRLGYWQTEGPRTAAMWYGIGSVSDEDQTRKASFKVGKKVSYRISPASSHDDLEAANEFARTRYLPTALSTLALVGSLVALVLFIVVILIVSFLPQTRLDRGFLPLVSARPGPGAFSAANFLYSFIPSTVGMLLFLLFQTLDHELRVLQPWAELSKPSGSIAEHSILADYAACVPFQATWRAVKNGHWRVAAVSLVGALLIFLPILAGGLFIALTDFNTQVRMFASMPVFGILVALLILAAGCLAALVPARSLFRLPHPVTCLAEIISLCAADETTQDPAFRSVYSSGDLASRLGLDRADAREQTMWFFGVSGGREECHLSVRPVKRFTEKTTRTTTRTRSMRFMR